MSGFYQERYHAVRLDANGSYTFSAGTPTNTAGFLCTATGTLTATRASGAVVINAFPVTAGVYHPMPFHIGQGATISLAGGAAGTLGVS